MPVAFTVTVTVFGIPGTAVFDTVTDPMETVRVDLLGFGLFFTIKLLTQATKT
jgi:hypothetical protein